MQKINQFVRFFLILWAGVLQATPDNVQLAVWANEAIVATYTFSYKDFIAQQRGIANYFTAEGWTNYSKALNASKLPEAVLSNSYFVNAVATLPPEITLIKPGQWRASMPLLVTYKNTQYQQKQTLQVVIHFSEAASGQGVRGLAINSLQSKISIPACRCQMVVPPIKSDTTTLPSVTQPATIKGQ